MNVRRWEVGLRESNRTGWEKADNCGKKKKRAAGIKYAGHEERKQDGDEKSIR